ncbi:phosphomannose isomerase/mannose-1-phosphate guanylyl transferase [Polynucleobacter sp. SHI8]|nr:phosphomannose isomerase/mannose-1-phosphate guanylyl transferase [Polynucleobacter sp. SHI2]BDW12639.1 phosphomannose isomerase/mannose-1-phosphate guanylyl transferase [Polynucleobacter sp. SHI8]
MSILIPVILSGGAGSRLWPVSREGHPKPFMKLADGQTLLEKTYRRAASIPNVYTENGKAKLLTVTNRDYYFMSRDELEKANATGTFLLEPFGRNTAPAIALAAHKIQAKFGPEALMLVLAADHLILDDVAFGKAVHQATELASAPHHLLVTFGILPTGPETRFGYVESAEKIANGLRVKAFIEKPDSKTAGTYLDAGNYFWNSGMFCFSAGQFLKQLVLCAPEVAKPTQVCWDAMSIDGIKEMTMIEIPEVLFKEVPDISVDYAVMEKSSEVAVVPGDFGWSDIGSWGAIRDLFHPNEDNNRASGDAIFVKSANTFVQSEDRIVATVGVQNLMIIDTKDALLVANTEHTQEVKTVVNILKQRNHDSYKLHSTVSRPWGTYTVLEDHPGFKIKRIEVRPGGKLSLQMHYHRSEHWIVVKGEAHIVNGETNITLLANQSTYIPAGHKHRLENRVEEDLVMIEVQFGSYLGEDDIVRFEDTYGRV